MARNLETPVYGGDDHDTAAGSGCCFFRRFCFGRDEDESHSSLLREKEEGHEERWLVAKLKNLREFSELVAGPKWKNLIRKLGRVCNPKKQNKTAAAHFHYSPESYALNFAGGADREEDDEMLHSFSTRFAHCVFINEQQRKPPAL